MVAMTTVISLLVNTIALCGYRRPGMAWAAAERKTDLEALSVAPGVPGALTAFAPQSHLPIGFDDLQTFHENLVAAAEGYFRLSYQDIVIPGLGPLLEVRRTYNSHVDRKSAFGLGWNWSYGVRLGKDEETGEPLIIDIDNTRIPFRQFGGDYVSVNTAVRERLEFAPPHAVRIFSDGARQFFDNAGRLVAVADASGRRLELRYQGKYLVEAVDTTGRTLRFLYSGPHITKIVDPLDREWRYEYSGDLLRYAYDPLGRQTEFVYLSRSTWRQRMSHVRFPHGADMEIVYHPVNKRVTSIQGPGPLSTTFKSYNNPHNRTMHQWITNSRGHTSQVDFMGQGVKVEEREDSKPESATPFIPGRDVGSVRYMENAISFRDPEGGKQQVAANANEVVVTDAMGRTAVIRKDDAGRLAQVTSPDNNQASLEWDATGKLSRINLAERGSVSFSYEGGELRSITDPLGHSTRIEPISGTGGQESGQGVRITDPTGGETILEVDRHGYPTRIHNTASGERRFTYDVVGRLRTATDPVGNTWHFTYDEADNLKEIRDPSGASTHIAYDKMDNPVHIVDPMGRETRFDYDGRGLVIQASYPGGEQVRYDYDPAGNLIATHDTRGDREVLAAHFTYDRNHRLVRMANPLGEAYEFTYDPAGFLTSLKNPRGQDVSFRHDALGCVLQENYPDGSSVQRSYGVGDQRQTALFRGAEGQESQLSYGYDAIGRLTSVEASGGGRREFTYDPAGRLHEARAPGGSYALAYDHEGRGVTVRGGPEGHPVELRYEHNLAGRLAALVEPGGERREYSYDMVDNLSALQVPGLGQIQMDWDPAGNPGALHLPGGLRAQFTYDAGGRLAGITYYDPSGAAVSSFGYTYDQQGNLRSATEAGQTQHYAYDDALRLIRVSQGDETNSVRYKFCRRVLRVLRVPKQGFQEGGSPVLEVFLGSPRVHFLVPPGWRGHIAPSHPLKKLGNSCRKRSGASKQESCRTLLG
jgi:YD repeat-containing protein